MLPTSSPLSIRSGSKRLGPREGEQAAGQRGGAGGAFHRIGQMVHHFLARAAQAAAGKVDPADDHREHIVEIVRDAAGQLADRFHLLDLAKLGLGRLPLDRFGFERLVGLPQFLGPVAHRFLELGGADRFAIGLAAGGGILAKRLDRDQAGEDRAAADDQPEPAEIIGQPVGLGGDDLALRDPLAQRLAFGVGRSRRASCRAGPGSWSGRRRRNRRSRPGPCRAPRRAPGATIPRPRLR